MGGLENCRGREGTVPLYKAIMEIGTEEEERRKEERRRGKSVRACGNMIDGSLRRLTRGPLTALQREGGTFFFITDQADVT